MEFKLSVGNTEVSQFNNFVPRVCMYRVSQEECARLREGVPYVKVYRYNPKHLCPKLNGYRDMAREKCGLLVGPRTVPVSLQVLSMFVLEFGVRFSSH